MALNFPASPNVSEIYTYGSTSYIWDGVSWNGIPSSVIPDIQLFEATVGTSGAQAYTLAYSSLGNNVLKINGLTQNSADYTVFGRDLTIPPGMLLVAGDKVIFTSNH
jgi:hypothetical protein